MSFRHFLITRNPLNRPLTKEDTFEFQGGVEFSKAHVKVMVCHKCHKNRPPLYKVDDGKYICGVCRNVGY